ncbi:arsenate reductase ArsC [Calditrichota bacterium]
MRTEEGKVRKKILILCTGNSCRSIMAEALINHHLHEKWTAYSAGVEPSKVNPRAIEVMKEIGIDISNSRSKSVDEFLSRDDLDLVITVCDHARETCPIFPSNVKTIHQGFEDPATFTNEPDEIALPKFREIRDLIKKELVPFLDNIEL